MRQSLRALLCVLFCLASACVCAQANAVQHKLLWITSDITTASRNASLALIAQELDIAVEHMSFPLTGVSQLTESQNIALRNALRAATWVWVDAPHASVIAHLQRVVGQPLQSWRGHRQVAASALWITESDAQSRPTAQEFAKLDATQRIRAYLQASGSSNLRQALMQAKEHVQQAGATALQSQAWPLPVAVPTRGLYHPDAPSVLPDATAMLAWQQSQSKFRDQTAVALLVHRHHFVDGSTAWLDTWLRQFAAEGIFAYAAFGQQVNAQSLTQLLELPSTAHSSQPGRLHASALVLHQLVTQAGALQPVFSRWGVPVLATQPFRAGTESDWAASKEGLSTADIPFYLAQPEAAGAIDPILMLSTGQRGAEPFLIERQALAVVAKVRRLMVLRHRPAAEKRLVAMVYNYPPGGTNFGASFLNVPRSLEQVSDALSQAGYNTTPVSEQAWIEGLKPLLAAYYPNADLRNLLQTGQASALALSEYEAYFNRLPAAQQARIQAHWGSPQSSRYVITWQGQQVFVIPRLQVGSLAVLPQPPREETLRTGQNPFMHKSMAPLSHHYLAVYLWAQKQGDALIHFGTHGTQEWAAGKSRALDVNDDALLPLGDLPVIYPYIVDNLGEALTAKRRGRAVMVSHRTPSFAPAGFEARMAQMHELMHEWETVDAGPTRRALEKQLVTQFVQHKLHLDLNWTAERIAANFAGYLEQLHPYLDALAQSSQPQGLAVFGRVPQAQQRRQTILQILRKPLIAALGEDIDEAFLIRYDAVSASRPARWLELALRDANAASLLDLRPLERSSQDHVPNRSARQPIDTPALLKLALRAQELERLLGIEGEIAGLLTALEGRYLSAAYGGDPIRNPDSMPTGRNLTGLDPSRLPTRQAYAVAQTLFDDWLKDYRQRHSAAMPRRLALSLWAGETLRHQGIMEAQAMVALGVRPVWDESGRPVRVEAISREQLGRDRVDVLLSVTGSYRDQFPALMALLDQAVAQAAIAEPGNAVSDHTLQVKAQLRRLGIEPKQAEQLARVRSFGNAAGDYGTGISDAVQSDLLQKNDARLGQLFLQRMSQPYLNGQALGELTSGAAVKAFGAHLQRTDAAMLSRSSHLYAMVSSDDPFQYLGGLSAAARAAGRAQGLELHVSQLQDVSEVGTQTAQRAIALEMQSRYLHPGWLQAQKEQGYAGTLQVLKAVQFTWGWQAIAPETVRSDHWQSLYEVLVRDRHQLGLPAWLREHPQAYAQSLERLVQAQRQGYWQSDANTRQELAKLYQGLTQAVPLAAELSQVRRWVQQAAQDPRAQNLSRDQNVNPITTQSYAAQPLNQAVATPKIGVLLQKQAEITKPAQTEPFAQRLLRILAALLMASIVLAGAAWQARQNDAPA